MSFFIVLTTGCLIISLNPQNSPVIAPTSWVKQLNFRDNCCDLLHLVLPDYHPRSHHPVCFLHEPRHPVGVAHHSHPLSGTMLALLIGGFQSQGLSHHTKCRISEDHASCYGTVAMPSPVPGTTGCPWILGQMHAGRRRQPRADLESAGGDRPQLYCDSILTHIRRCICETAL